MPGRSWKVYVLPPSVGRGTATARSGTMVDPLGPPTFSNATRPSFVVLRTPQLSEPYATAGSMESKLGLCDSSVTAPPRWPGPEPTVATQSEEPTATAACGAFPTGIRVACPDPGAITETE